jgi:hypothetical protein
MTGGRGLEDTDGSGMVPTSSNKRKFEDDTPATPIVFISPGFPPDVRLTVFNQDFHVHSIFLKIYSAEISGLS